MHIKQIEMLLYVHVWKIKLKLQYPPRPLFLAYIGHMARFCALPEGLRGLTAIVVIEVWYLGFDNKTNPTDR